MIGLVDDLVLLPLVVHWLLSRLPAPLRRLADDLWATHTNLYDYAEVRPDADAEQIVMLARLWKALGLSGIALQVNSIGNAHERLAHRQLAIVQAQPVQIAVEVTYHHVVSVYGRCRQ